MRQKSEWMGSQYDHLNDRQKPKDGLQRMRMREKAAHEAQERKQEEAVKIEFQNRKEAEGKDILDEEYFRDTMRFKIENDPRDPLTRGIKGKDHLSFKE